MRERRIRDSRKGDGKEKGGVGEESGLFPGVGLFPWKRLLHETVRSVVRSHDPHRQTWVIRKCAGHS